MSPQSPLIVPAKKVVTNSRVIVLSRKMVTNEVGLGYVGLLLRRRL